LECVVALLSRGAEVNIGDHEDNTPLHLAVTQGHLAIVQALVVFGADLSYKYEYLKCYIFSALIKRSRKVLHGISFEDLLKFRLSRLIEEHLKLLFKVTEHIIKSI